MAILTLVGQRAANSTAWEPTEQPSLRLRQHRGRKPAARTRGRGQSPARFPSADARAPMRRRTAARRPHRQSAPRRARRRSRRGRPLCTFVAARFLQPTAAPPPALRPTTSRPQLPGASCRPARLRPGSRAVGTETGRGFFQTPPRADPSCPTRHSNSRARRPRPRSGTGSTPLVVRHAVRGVPQTSTGATSVSIIVVPLPARSGTSPRCSTCARARRPRPPRRAAPSRIGAIGAWCSCTAASPR